MSNPAPGWYADPTVPGQQRYWDGNAWSEQVAPMAPPPPAPVAPPPPAPGGFAAGGFPQAGVQPPAGVSSKSKVAAGILGILLGALGVHNFYLGFTGKAVAQLLISVLTLGLLSFIPAIWGLVEGIIILTNNDARDADGLLLQ